MSDTVDVTVVLPIYNAEKFLDQALTSAEQNDQIELEILAINDGSKDGSLKIMEEHAQKDPRVRVIDKPNQGYGATMNRGFSEARGRYLAILEPDDYVAPHMYDDMMAYLKTFEDQGEQNIDVIKTPYTRVWMPGTKREHLYNCSYKARVKPEKQPFTLHDVPRLIQHHPSIWSALYRTDFIRENNIRFKEVPGAGWVDNPFLIETLCLAQKIIYLDTPYYFYREDLPGSSSANRSNTLPIERWNDMCDVMDRLHIDDPAIRNSLGVIAFRYTGGLIGDGALEDPELKAGIAGIFKRMGREQILRIPNIDPRFKKGALAMIGEEVPEIDGKSYRDALVNEFFYTKETNGLAFALTRIRLFLQRRFWVKSLDPTKTRSSSI